MNWASFSQDSDSEHSRAQKITSAKDKGELRMKCGLPSPLTFGSHAQPCRLVGGLKSWVEEEVPQLRVPLARQGSHQDDFQEFHL